MLPLQVGTSHWSPESVSSDGTNGSILDGLEGNLEDLEGIPLMHHCFCLPLLCPNLTWCFHILSCAFLFAHIAHIAHIILIVISFSLQVLVAKEVLFVEQH